MFCRNHLNLHIVIIFPVHLPILFHIHVFSDCTDNNYYIADESDEEEFNEEETVTILSFFNDCSLQELTSVPTLSSKKAEKIIKMRPFDSWNDLVRMFLLPNSILYPYSLYYIMEDVYKCSCQRKHSLCEKQGVLLKASLVIMLKAMYERIEQSDQFVMAEMLKRYKVE